MCLKITHSIYFHCCTFPPLFFSSHFAFSLPLRFFLICYARCLIKQLQEQKFAFLSLRSQLPLCASFFLLLVVILFLFFVSVCSCSAETERSPQNRKVWVFVNTNERECACEPHSPSLLVSAIRVSVAE